MKRTPEKNHALRGWVASFILTVGTVCVSYEWFDRPVAFFVHDYVGQNRIFVRLQQLPEGLAPLSVILLVALGLTALAARPFSTLQTVFLLCSLSFVVAETIKNQLKFVFGRTWPETWVGNNPSLIHDGAYGFNFFHGGAGFASFPSGHTSAICAVTTVLWIYYPRFRPLYILFVSAVVLGLIGADYHFLSDIIAGGFVGVSAGWMVVMIWKTNRGVPALD